VWLFLKILYSLFKGLSIIVPSYFSYFWSGLITAAISSEDSEVTRGAYELVHMIAFEVVSCRVFSFLKDLLSPFLEGLISPSVFL
jgi:hypothetical protein